MCKFTKGRTVISKPFFSQGAQQRQRKSDKAKRTKNVVRAKKDKLKQT